MKISFFLKTTEGFQILAKAHELEKAIEILKNINADGVMLDIDTAKYLFLQANHLPKHERTHVASRTHQGIQRVPIQEIYYFQADQKYVTVHHQKGALLIEDTLKDLETEFSDRFLRIHRNLLVNKNEIQYLEKDAEGAYFLKLYHFEKLFPVSRRKVPEVRRQMSK